MKITFSIDFNHTVLHAVANQLNDLKLNHQMLFIPLLSVSQISFICAQIFAIELKLKCHRLNLIKIQCCFFLRSIVFRCKKK